MGTKSCPFCAEDVLEEAIKCKHCGSMLDGSAAQQNEAPVASQPKKGKTPTCQHCDGEMAKKTKAKHSRLLVLFLGVVGIILIVTVVAWFIGLPMVLIAFIMLFGTKKFWKCKNCGAVLERA